MKSLKITVNGVAYDVQVEEVSASAAAAVPAVSSAPVVPAAQAASAEQSSSPAPKAEATATPAAQAEVPAGAELISCPMPGTIVSIPVRPGQSIQKGDVLLILEAMKMENEIMAPHDAVVAAVHVNKGDSVDSGTPLVSLQ